jgi:dinuclear metal center YbgI/SA1388 family protein
MAPRDQIVARANELLEVERFPEYGLPGLQVVGTDEVTKLVCGVSCSLELFDRAAAAGAQLLLVHHGMFWRNEPLVVDRRLRGRLEALFRADLSLVAYHLALDAHPELGNNAQLALALGIQREGEFKELGLAGRLEQPCGIEEFQERVLTAVQRYPTVFPHGPERIERVAISTGGAGAQLIEAAHEGFDLFLTGEPEEPSLHTARELGIHFVAAGHYATETLGIRRLGELVAERFGVRHVFADIPNPV